MIHCVLCRQEQEAVTEKEHLPQASALTGMWLLHSFQLQFLGSSATRLQNIPAQEAAVVGPRCHSSTRRRAAIVSRD